MDRRRFLSDVGLGGYSLVVLAGELSAQTPPPRSELPRTFDQIAPPEATRHMASSEPHMTLVELDCDLVVAGGGLAGVCAAVSAARHGARVVLVQDRSRLGGNSSSEVKMHVVGANSHKGRPGWREGGLIEEFRLDDAANNPQRCWELWDLMLYDKVVSEPRITLLLESTVYAATTRDGKIEEVTVRCDKSEHLYRIRARLYCDATGDSRLGLEAGAEIRWGREKRSEFGESLAPEKPDRETLGSSILFTSRLHHQRMPFTAPAWARKITKEQLRHRRIDTWEYGYWWVEWGGNIDTIRDNERIRFELLSIVMGVWDYIKNSGEFPDAANWAMDWVGMMPGRRGSRRIVGDHILTQHDLLRGDFDDAVAIGGWPMDDHPPGGFDRPDLPPNTVLRTPEVYHIPLRALYSRNVANLMMAGRNISATHAAFTSTRVMATCAAVGQAAGTAAAHCLESGLLPHALAQSRDKVRVLQQALLRDDQTIRGFRNEDRADLALRATVRASAEDADAPARNLINGVTRDIPKSPGNLTLTSSDSANRGIVRAAQPETVRDYRILARRAGSSDLVEIAAAKGNHQRLRRHRFDVMEVDAIRIHVIATNGDDRARIFEMRCYG
jgi:hypothetical protein